MVEVIVALALLGITLIAIFGVMRTCAGAAHHARMLTGSVLLGETLIAEAATSKNPAFETRQASVGLYHWELRLAQTPVESLGAVHVKINWLEQQRPQQYELLTFIRMKPAIEGK